MSACWLLQIPPTAKSVLMAMAFDADAEGVCSPSLASLAGMTCFERTAIWEAVKYLEEEGLITAQRHEGKRTVFTIVAAQTRSPNGRGGSPAGRVKRASTPLEETSDGFRRFWAAYPNTGRKVSREQCWKRWQSKGLEIFANQIEAHVLAMCQTEQWQSGFEPATTTYLNQCRWADPVPAAQKKQITAKEREREETIAALTGRSNNGGIIDAYTEILPPRICH